MLKVADIEHVYDTILDTFDVLSISGTKLCVLLGKTKKPHFVSSLKISIKMRII